MSYSQTPHDPSIRCSLALLDEWSGDTLVASEAKDFLDQYRLGIPSEPSYVDRHWGGATTRPPRLFPTIRSSMSPSKALFDGLRTCQTPLFTDLLPDYSLNSLPNSDGQPPSIVDNDCFRKCSLSSGTVKTSLPAHTPQGLMLTLDEIPDSSFQPIYSSCETLEEMSKTSSLAERDSTQGRGPQGAAKRVRVKKPWQSPSQEDFSCESRYRIRLSKSAYSSPTKSAAAQKRGSKLNLSKETLHLPRLRSKSLDQLEHVREGPGAEASIIHSKPNHAAQTVGMTAGRKIKGNLTGKLSLPPRPRNGTPYTILSPAIEPSFWSDSSVQSSPCRRRSAQDGSDGISIHDRQVIDSLTHGGLHFNNDGYEPSSDADSSNDGIHQDRKAEGRLSPLEISCSSLIPRGTSSSPLALRNAQPYGNNTSEPFWTRFEGKLCVCFPSNPERTTYRVEVHAEIDLSAPDAEGWSSFFIPGLPRLHASQASGRLIFLHERGQEVFIDKGSLDFFDDAEAIPHNLLSGGSHFDVSPLLRLRPVIDAVSLESLGSLKYRHYLLPPALDDSIKTDEAEVGTQQGDALSKWTDKQIRLCPIHFLGLASRDDPLELEDPSKLIWSFQIRIDRIITGELECQMSLDIDIGSVPLLMIDARDWVPNYSIIDGKLATHGEWRETENGDMALQSMASTRLKNNITKVDVYWKEFNGIADDLTGREATPTRDIRLPNTVGKIVLNGSLTCNIDNAFIVLNDTYGEEITWRADSMIGCNAIRLPKLYPGYSIHLKVNEASPSISDDLASLPDGDIGAGWQPAAPREKVAVAEEVDQRIGDLKVPEIPVKALPPVQDPTVESSTSTTVPPNEPSISRRLLKYCILTFVLLHILKRISTVSAPNDQCSSLQTLQQNETKPQNEHFLADSTFGLDPGFSTTHDLWITHVVSSVEVQLGSEPRESDPTVVAIPADEVQKTGRETKWRDRIDRALGWRELGR